MSHHIALASRPRIAPAPVRARSSAGPAQIRRALSGPGPRRNYTTTVRVATDAAKMGITFVGLGLHPGMGSTHFLPRAVGDQVAARMMLTGNTPIT